MASSRIKMKRKRPINILEAYSLICCSGKCKLEPKMRHYYVSTKSANTELFGNTELFFTRVRNNRKTHPLLVRDWAGAILWKATGCDLIYLRKVIISDAINPNKNAFTCEQETGMEMFIVAHSKIAQICKQPGCPSVCSIMLEKVWCIPAIGCKCKWTVHSYTQQPEWTSQHNDEWKHTTALKTFI